MRLEDMSFTDYLMAECDLRERQRKERMKQAEFEKYAKEHNLFVCSTNVLEQIRAEIERQNIADFIAVQTVIEIIDKYAKQEPISVSVSEKEPDEISEEVTLRFFRNSLKVRWQDLVIYNVEWLKKNWQMEMDIVCGVKPCDDVVSRQAVYEILEGNWNTDFLRAEVEKLPSVRPQEPMEKQMVEKTCDTCEYRTAVFMPCNACEDKSEYEPQESEDKE